MRPKIWRCRFWNRKRGTYCSKNIKNGGSRADPFDFKKVIKIPSSFIQMKTQGKILTLIGNFDKGNENWATNYKDNVEDGFNYFSNIFRGESWATISGHIIHSLFFSIKRRTKNL
jgi:hypothetical protein